MSQTIQLGETGSSLVNKFNYNAQLIYENQVNINNLTKLVNNIPQGDIIINNYYGSQFILDSFKVQGYLYYCYLKTTPLIWRFYITNNFGVREYLELDSAYVLFSDESGGFGIVFNYDLLDISKLVLEVISYE